MSPLKSLYFFAPICLLLNLLLLLPLEGLAPLYKVPELGWGLIFVNASLTFGLNLSAVMLIGISSMVLSLSKVVKDVLMVVAPALLLGESVSPTLEIASGRMRADPKVPWDLVDDDSNRWIWCRYSELSSSSNYFRVC